MELLMRKKEYFRIGLSQQKEEIREKLINSDTFQVLYYA
jgi:hypothetical protein